MEKITFQNQNLVVNAKGGGIAEYYLKEGSKRIDIVFGYSKQSEFDSCMGDILSLFPGRIKNGIY